MPEALDHGRIVRTETRATSRQRALEQRFRSGKIRLEPEELAELVHARRDLHAPGGKCLAAQPQRLLGERQGAAVEAESDVRRRHGVEKPGTNRRLGGEVGAQAVDAGVEELLGGERRPPGEGRIRALEQSDEERSHLLRGPRLARFRPCLSERRRAGPDEREEKRRGNCERPAMAGRESPGAIPDAVRPGTNREEREMPPEVLGERRDRRTPAMGLVSQGGEKNGVDVPAQGATQPPTRRLSAAGDGHGRAGPGRPLADQGDGGLVRSSRAGERPQADARAGRGPPRAPRRRSPS